MYDGFTLGLKLGSNDGALVGSIVGFIDGALVDSIEWIAIRKVLREKIRANIVNMI